VSLRAASQRSPGPRVEDILTGLDLQLHRGKTKVVDLREGREGFDFLGCHFPCPHVGAVVGTEADRALLPAPLAQPGAMKRLRERSSTGLGATGVGVDVQVVINELNPILARLGAATFAPGMPPTSSPSLTATSCGGSTLQIKKRGRNLRAGQAQQWTQDWFNGHGLHQLRGSIRYPKAA